MWGVLLRKYNQVHGGSIVIYRTARPYVSSGKLLATRAATLALIVTTIMCVSVSAQHDSTVISTEPTAANVLHQTIERAVKKLQYSDAVAQDLTGMVGDWKDEQGRPALAVLNEKLAEARQACTEGRISKSQLAKTEEHMIMRLGRIIRREIAYKGDCFDLSDVVESEVANCFGFSQLLYVLGTSTRLSVWPASVLPEHIANIVVLSDGTMTVVDLTNSNGFVSERIITDPRVEGSGSHWRFENKGDLVRNGKTIHILDKNELLGEIYFCRGTVDYMSGRSAEAISDFKRATQLNPQCAKAYNNRGSAHLALGQYREAISNFNHAIELDPAYRSAYHNRANAYLGSGQYTQAVLDYSNTLNLDPGFAKAYLGRGYAHLAEGKYAQAVSDYTRVIDLKPDTAKAHYMRAISYAYLAEHDKARSGMLQAVDLDRTLRSDVEDMSRKFALNLKLN